MHITTIGLDLAKHWFQIHGIDAAGKVETKSRSRRIFPKARALPGWHGSLRDGAPLGARADRAGT
jgi:hypothetical protein